jgi:hypothetical protein
MSTWWIAVVALAVVPEVGETLPDVAAAPVVVQEQPLVSPRTPAELRDAVRAALRRWARVDNRGADLAAREFLGLYRELEADDQLARATREELRNKVRSRLLKLAEQISKRTAVEKRLAKDGQPESVEAAAAGNSVLAQLGGFGGPGGIGGRGFGGPAFGWHGGFGMPGFAGGGFGVPGPGRGMLGGGPFGGAGQFTGDYGPQLVDLIQRTIAPQTWDVNGGLGTIYYWRPGRALVVRQTDDVHDQIGGLLQQMGRMGR